MTHCKFNQFQPFRRCLIGIMFFMLMFIAGCDLPVRPVLFIHGGAGSASQFESQAQRFMANGYPLDHIAVYEYNTSAGQDAFNEVQAAERNRKINEIIDDLLKRTGADKVDLIAHSMGTAVSFVYLSKPENAARVAHYISIDGYNANVLPGNVPTLAIWGQYVTSSVFGAENVYPDPDKPVGHIESCTSADSFVKIFNFINGFEPPIKRILPAPGHTVRIAGRANLFPVNTGAEGTVLEIYEVDKNTGYRKNKKPVYRKEIGSSGEWGPCRIKKMTTYEFALLREGAGNNQYFYREGFVRDDYFVRLNTSLPGSGVGSYLHRSPNHINLMIGRDKELWGNQGDSNDILTVEGVNIVTEKTAPLLKRLSTIFLHDRNSDQVSNLAVPDPFFHALPFMSGLDFYIPASTPPDRTISVKLVPRGGGDVQVINVPNWPSNEIRSVSVQFRDYSE